jgi:hypothetical protein
MLNAAWTVIKIWLSELIRDPLGTLRFLPLDLCAIITGRTRPEMTSNEDDAKLLRSCVIKIECALKKIISKLTGGAFNAEDCFNRQDFRVSILLLKLLIFVLCLLYIYGAYLQVMVTAPEKAISSRVYAALIISVFAWSLFC